MAAILQREQFSVFDFARAWNPMSPGTNEILQAVTDLRRLQESGLIIGGIALNYYGYKRLTEDVDLFYARRDSKILERLTESFDVVLNASNGWHELKHRATGIRLELIPEGSVGSAGYLPFLDSVEGKDGFISLPGLIWLKLAAGRAKDEVDVMELAKLRMQEVESAREQLPSELHSRFDELLVKAKKELDDDPWRGATGMKRASIRDPRKPNP